ncbi:MAG TPA: hypothetical protein VHC49_09040 [Mycobacteriales bacterium]|nr:hypothetical protein [Mycobacteriales bacterium]
MASLLTDGMVIPAHPLALDAEGTFQERNQRALTRYYRDAGAGGIAVGVHTTQFQIREAGLLKPVLECTTETLADRAERPLLIAGACGPTAQAVAETELAAGLGYDAVLLSPGGLADQPESALLERSAAIGEILPVVGFYLQEAVGGRYLSSDFWRQLADQPSTVAIKVAAFDRYRTLDVARGVSRSGRADQVALYTGNDDAIIHDLLTVFPSGSYFRGGLLGQFAVWTHQAVRIVELAGRSRAGDVTATTELLRLAPRLTDANGAVFDVANGFAGCIGGVNEVLRRQGLLTSARTLEPADALSPGQDAELDRVGAAYPELTDDEFVRNNLAKWLAD